MNSNIQFLKNNVTLNSYSSSKGFIGYFERTGKFNETKCHDAIELFIEAFSLSTAEFIFLSSLCLNSDIPTYIKDYEISNNHLINHLYPLIKEGIIRKVDYNTISSDVESEEYSGTLKALDENFTTYNYTEIKMERLRSAFFCQMALGGTSGHCFIILPSNGVIAYPHDDTGFGFISFPDANKKAIGKYLKDKFNFKGFAVTLK
jgi:hypothetical protein